MKIKQRSIAWFCALVILAGSLLTSPGWTSPAHAAGSSNLAEGKPTSASGHADVYVASNATDGNSGTYWESTNHAFPQWLQVDLGSAATIDQAVMKLPAGWESRSQTLSVQGSTDGSSFTDLKASASYTFDPNSGNAVTIDFPSANARYVRIQITANTGWPAAQLSELEIYGPPPVEPDPSSDLIGAVSWTPSNPSAGSVVTFSVNLKNQGSLATANGPHTVTVQLKDAADQAIETFIGSYNGVLAPGAFTNVVMGTWTVMDGSYTVTTTVGADANESPENQANNTSTSSLYSGRGANMPFTILEAEAPGNLTNGTRLTPNFTPGDFAGEASGRSAVHLDASGEYVEFTLTSPANAFVLRNAVNENTTGTISIYADGVDKGNFNVTSKFSYVYATPSTLGRLGYDNSGSKAYWLYEDAQLMLDQVYPAGTKIKIQKDAGDVPWIYVDMIETEHVAPPASNPDPGKYVQVSNTKSIEQALNEFRQDSSKKGIFIPAGEWTMTSKIHLYGRATEIIGAGPWHTKLVAPQNQTNTDIGFNISSEANGTTIKDLSAWGNYVYRQDGPGKFIDGNGMQNVTIENIWAEHFICLYWGVNSSHNTFKNNRIKNVFADGINMTNGSSYNVIDNNYARGTGDDAFALFSAIDAGGSYNVGNVYTNLTATNVRRAAAFAIYGGKDNLFQNLYGADTLTYPGLTVSSLSFGYNTLGFGDQDTVIDGVTLERTGGDFWTSVGADDKINDYQNFGAIWLHGGDRDFKNILIKNVDINQPVYFGIMLQSKSPEHVQMQNIRLENITINNPSRYGIKLVAKAENGQGPVVGSATFTNVVINNPGVTAIYGESKSPGFTVIRGSGNNW